MDKMQIYQRLRNAERYDIYFEDVFGTIIAPDGDEFTGNYQRIVWDDLTDEAIPFVVVDVDDLEIEADEHGVFEWKTDKAFLKDQFWANLDWLNVIEP